MDFLDQQPVEPIRPDAGRQEVNAAEPVEILPTMADLDRLASDLDRVDLTLVEIDGPAQLSAS